MHTIHHHFPNSSLPSRLVWQGGDKPRPPETVQAKKEFSEIGDMVHKLEGVKETEQAKYDEAVNKLYEKLRQTPSYFSPELLNTLSQNRNPKIRIGVALNENTSNSLRMKIITDFPVTDNQETVTLLSVALEKNLKNSSELNRIEQVLVLSQTANPMLLRVIIGYLNRVVSHYESTSKRRGVDPHDSTGKYSKVNRAMGSEGFQIFNSARAALTQIGNRS